MMRRGERPRRSRRLLAAREASAACEASTSARAAVLSLLPWTLKRKGSSCLSDSRAVSARAAGHYHAADHRVTRTHTRGSTTLTSTWSSARAS